ncbi:hypothetical protein [uncultured Chryseobacterium sp.]|uniref:hypothetical protein n=1 Tax=uncultured Chryseobacterium sp. TaxID=259322 RepID=UPI0025EC56D5|nr:hypothetical protein [uncultured Chryseobacterium sp.]
MKKNLLTAAACMASAALYSQVGINNLSPKATLDITAKTTDGSKPEGIIAPRLTGNQIEAASSQYGPDQQGAIVYATSLVNPAGTKTANITAEGYYFFDGNIWQKVGSGADTGMYKSSGSLSGNTVVAQNANTLSFTGTSVNAFSVDGNTFSVDAANHRLGVGTATPGSKLEINGSATNTSAYDAGNSTAIDFSNSNLAYTSASAGAFTLQNIKDGGTYTLSIRGTTSGTSSFTATGFTFKYVNNNSTVANTHTLYTFVVMGTVVYVYSLRGL